MSVIVLNIFKILRIPADYLLNKIAPSICLYARNMYSVVKWIFMKLDIGEFSYVS